MQINGEKSLHTCPTPEEQPDVAGGATAGEPEPDEVRDEPNAKRVDDGLRLRHGSGSTLGT
jgi:hypothetical protein